MSAFALSLALLQLFASRQRHTLERVFVAAVFASASFMPSHARATAKIFFFFSPTRFLTRAAQCHSKNQSLSISMPGNLSVFVAAVAPT